MATITDYESMQSVSGRNKRRRKTVRPAGMPVGIFTQDDRGDIQEERRRDHAISKDERDESARSEGQGFAEAPGNGMPCPTIRGGNGQGPTIHETALSAALGWPCNVSVRILHMKRGSGYPGSYKLDIANSDLMIGVEVDGFSSQLYGEAVSGSKKGGVLNFERVARVKVYKQGSGDEFEWPCLREEVLSII